MDDPVSLALELGEDRGRRLFELLGAKAALRDLRRVCATRYAVQLLRGGEKDRAVIRDRIMTRYGTGRRNAYYCIDAALDQFVKLCSFEGRSCTHTPQDLIVEKNVDEDS